MSEQVPYPRAQRSKNCRCCNTQGARVQKRVGTPSDPDYLVAVCPTCDTA